MYVDTAIYTILRNKSYSFGSVRTDVRKFVTFE